MLLSEMRVVTPGTLDEALALLRRHGTDARPLAGGTDAMVRIKEGDWHVPLWVNIQRLTELRGANRSGDMVEVGAAMPFSRMLRDPGLRESAPLLLRAVGAIGSVQIRSTGTLGGNLGTASPAGDSIPALYALDAKVRLVSADGERLIPIEQFFRGPGQTVRRSDELIAAVRFDAQAGDELSSWQKLGLRGAQAISIVSMAMRLTRGAEPGRVGLARIAFGAVGPTVLRARRCEEMLTGAGSLDAARLGEIAWNAAREVAPISDIRAGAEYRRHMAAALLHRGLSEWLGVRGDD